MLYRLYGVATGLPGAAGGLIRESTPPEADSGCGTPGWHRLFREPAMPDWPREQNPSSPPMSPIPGTEQSPPAGACGACPWSGVTLASVVACTVVACTVLVSTGPGFAAVLDTLRP